MCFVENRPKPLIRRVAQTRHADLTVPPSSSPRPPLTWRLETDSHIRWQEHMQIFRTCSSVQGDFISSFTLCEPMVGKETGLGEGRELG